VLDGDTLEYLQRFLQCIKHILFEFTLLCCCLSSTLPDSWKGFNRCHFCIYLHVYTLFVPPPLFPPVPLFCSEAWGVVLQFCRRKNIKDNKKNMVFLLVWDKDSYTEIPSIASMLMCVTTQTGSFYQSSSLLPSPLPIAAWFCLEVQWIYWLIWEELIFSQCWVLPVSLYHLEFILGLITVLAVSLFRTCISFVRIFSMYLIMNKWFFLHFQSNIVGV
jgi:hypothetical protein